MAANADLSKPFKKRKGPEIPSVATVDKRQPIDLKDWISISILARYGSGKSVYRPGKIVAQLAPASIQVLLDKQTEPLTYDNVFTTGDILGNHPPPALQIKEGITVCIREHPNDNLFVTGVVKTVEPGPPVRCLVESENLPSVVWVPRANVRLLQPPWHDDLLGANVEPQVRTVNSLS